jgi:hypothetical protein
VQQTAPIRTNSEQYHSDGIEFMATTHDEATKNSQKIKALTTSPISQRMISAVRHHVVSDVRLQTALRDHAKQD